MKQKIRQFKKSLPWSSSPVFRNCLIIAGIILAIFIIAVIVHLNQTRPSTTSQPSTDNTTTSKPTTQPKSSTKTEPTSKSESQTTTPEATPKTPEATPKAPEEVTKPEPTPAPVSQPETTQPETPAVAPQPETATPKCWHSVAGRCYDDLEEEAAAAGYYDHLNGEYEGRSFDTPDDCDAVCQDILEEAYYEGYYDY